MVASEFVYRHRFWMILLVYSLAYSFYNLENLNVLYAIVPWNQGVPHRDMLVRYLYAGAALVAAVGAFLLTWSSAYRPPSSDRNHTPFSSGGPYRYVRNPQYWAYFLLLRALGTFQSVLGFPVMVVGDTFLLVLLARREELRLAREYGERFHSYAQRVPRFLPSVRPQVLDNRQSPNWRLAFWDQAFQWGFVATLLAFAFTLSDPVGYAFGGATIAFLLLQRLSQAPWIRSRRNIA